MKTFIKSLLITIAGSFLLVGCCTTHKCCSQQHNAAVTQWEYKSLDITVPDSTLDKYGAEGWTVDRVYEIPNNGGSHFLLRRAKPPS